MRLPTKQFVTTLALLAMTTTASLAQSVTCGGKLSTFLTGVKNEAVANGLNAKTVDKALRNTKIDKKVLSRDRAQGVFKQTFLEFSKRSVSQNRLDHGAKNLKKYRSTFDRAQKEYGIPGPVIAAFWGLETDFGAFQGDFNTLNALVTLAHDCRRPHLFRPQLLAALEMVQHGDLIPSQTTGAWAGEIGQVQMLPEDIVRFGVDGDGDGHVKLKKSAPDAILTAANFIKSLGWNKNQPWLMEVNLPNGNNFPYASSGLGQNTKVSDWANVGVTPRYGKFPNGKIQANLLLPQGRKGPAFLAFPNFAIYLEWNQSFIYTTSAAYFATRLNGAPRYNAGNPEQGLSDKQMRLLQTKLSQKGYDVGKIDGILGAKTRSAVRAEQIRNKIPADGWPTPKLLNRI